MSIMQNKVALDEIKIKSYRSCRETIFQPNPQLTALIGINGAGKTNILNAISLLSPTFSPRWQNSELKDGSAETKTVIIAWFDVNGEKVGLRLQLTLGSTRSSKDEVLKYEEEWCFPSFTKSRVWNKPPPFLQFGSR